MEYNEVHFPFGGAFPATAERTAGRRSGGPYAPVMELVDMRDLGSRAATRVGSSPFRRTNLNDPTQSEQIVVSCSDWVGSFFACSP